MYMCETAGYSVRCWVGYATGTLKRSPFNISGTHSYGLEMGVRPPSFEVVAFASLDHHNFTSNTLFYILDVFCVIVLHLFSRGTNFHSNKHSRNYTQGGLVNLRKVRTSWAQGSSSAYLANSCICNLFLFSFFFLIQRNNIYLLLAAKNFRFCFVRAHACNFCRHFRSVQW